MSYVYAVQLANGSIATTPSGTFFTSRNTAREAKKLVKDNEGASVVRVEVKTASWERVR
jgi:hypothetical protein